MKRLVVLGLLLAAAACASQPPPPTATAPPPQLAAAPPSAPIPPPPPASKTSFDGLYKGSLTQEAYGGSTETLTGGNCTPETAVSMRIKRGDVRIWYKDWKQHTLHYRGRIDATGKVEASHTNSGGEGAILALQVSDNQVTGNLERGRCYYQVSMTKA